jgi:hypothetical protein
MICHNDPVVGNVVFRGETAVAFCAVARVSLPAFEPENPDSSPTGMRVWVIAFSAH